MRLLGIPPLPPFLGMWLLISSEYVEFEISPAFRKVVLNALRASPTSVDLRSQSAQFYAFAEKIMNLYTLSLGYR